MRNSINNSMRATNLDNYFKRMEEPKKVFYQRDNVGNSKYTINFNDGVKKHQDGSLFFDIAIFKSRVRLNAFVKELVSNGYKIRN